MLADVRFDRDADVQMLEVLDDLWVDADGKRLLRPGAIAVGLTRLGRGELGVSLDLGRLEECAFGISGPEALVRNAEMATADLRSAGKVTGDLVFTVDDSVRRLVASLDAALARICPV